MIKFKIGDKIVPKSSTGYMIPKEIIGVGKNKYFVVELVDLECVYTIHEIDNNFELEPVKVWKKSDIVVGFKYNDGDDEIWEVCMVRGDDVIICQVEEENGQIANTLVISLKHLVRDLNNKLCEELK